MAKKPDKTEKKGFLITSVLKNYFLPIAAFLHAGGLPKKDAEDIFRRYMASP